MVNKRELIISAISLLVGVFITSFILQNYFSNTTIEKSKIGDVNKDIGTIIAAQSGSFNGNGKLNTVQLQLLSKFDQTASPKKNARLVLIENGKQISTKDVTLETNIGYLELVNLFDHSHQQILFTTGVGPHSMYGFLYQLKNGTLSPICPDDSKTDIKQGIDCYFFSDAPSIYAEDLNGDGISEIISGNFTYHGDPQANPTIYKWNGSIYETVLGTQYDKFLAILKSKK